MANSIYQNRSRGFTLIEILVALTILAVGMAALVKAAGGNAANALYLKEKTFAHWVAMNKVAEIRLQKQWPNTGTQSGRVFFADVEWYWRVKTMNTQDKEVRRLLVTVQQEEERDSDPVAQLSAFIGKP